MRARRYELRHTYYFKCIEWIFYDAWMVMTMEPNLLVIVCDTLRKDILNVYGGPARATHIERLAKDSVVYQNAVAPSTWTLPSHLSLFTGLYAGQHGVHEDGVKFDAVEVMERSREFKAERLSEWLSKRGYECEGISNNPWISSLTGFNAGFREFSLLDNQPQWIMDGIIKASKLGSSKKEILSKLISNGELSKFLEFGNIWANKVLYDYTHNFPMDKGAKMTVDALMEREWSGKFFKFINMVEAHEPYRGEGDKERWGAMLGFQKMDRKRAGELKMEYVRETEYLDKRIGMITGLLKAKGVYDDTLIIVTSDHGQEFMEHGYMYHGIYVHDEIARIPLIIKYPKGKKYEIPKGYQGLTTLNSMIKSVAEGGDADDLTTDSVFSESYGMCHVVPPRFTHEKIDEDYSKTRVAVYENNYKLTYNITDSKAEELLLGEKRLDVKANRRIVNDMFGLWKGMHR